MSFNNINIHNQDYNNICMICHESYDNSNCYCLPECKHTFHVNCIVTWFRNGDSRCPYCGNKGVNFCSIHNKTYFYNYGSYENQVINDIKKVVNQDKDNKLYKNITKELEKLKELEKKQTLILQEKREYDEFIKKNEVNYNEAKKKIKSFMNEKQSICHAIIKHKFKIVNNSYIIPLILPIKLNI